MRKPKTKAGKKAKMEKTMGEYKRGKLESGSGHPVKARDQAIAIGLNQSGQSRRKRAARDKRLEGESL
jgi:hypothetical protein